MARRERDILERSVHAVAKQAAKANELVDDILAAGFGKSDPVVVRAKMIRLELLQVKGDLERELAKLVLNCTACGQVVHQSARPSRYAAAAFMSHPAGFAAGAGSARPAAPMSADALQTMAAASATLVVRVIELLAPECGRVPAGRLVPLTTNRDEPLTSLQRFRSRSDPGLRSSRRATCPRDECPRGFSRPRLSGA